MQSGDTFAHYEILGPIVHTPDKSKPRTLRVVVNWFTKLTSP